MPRGRKRISPDDTEVFFAYLTDCKTESGRWASIVCSDDPSASQSALDAIPLIQFCPIDDYGRVAQVPDLDLFNAWTTNHVTDAAWNRILAAARQRRHAKRNSITSIKVSKSTQRRIGEIAARLDTDLEGVLVKMATFAEQHPDLIK